MAELSNPHDRFFKETFSQPEIAADFLANHLPPELSLELADLQPVREYVETSLRFVAYGGRAVGPKARAR